MATRPPLAVDTGAQQTQQTQKRPGWRGEFGSRTVTAVFSFIAVVLFGTTVHESKKRYGGADWTDGMAIAPLLIALLYNLFIILFTTLWYKRAIHPGFSVAADLLVWVVGVPSIVFSVGDGWFWWWQPVVFTYPSGRIPCRGVNFWSKHCQPLIYKLGKQEIAANVFLALVMIIHFVLFVRACMMTHRLRKQKKVEAAERRNIQLQYHRSPELHKRDAPTFPSENIKRESAASPISPASTLSADEAAMKYA